MLLTRRPPPPISTTVCITVRNCTRDEGRPFEFGNQVLISSHRTAGGTLALATAYSSWLSAVPRASAAGTLTGSPSAFQRAFTGGISSHQSPLCSLGASHRRAGLEETMRIAEKIGPTIFARSFILITIAMR